MVRGKKMKNVFDFDYNKSIVSLSNSLLKYYGVEQTHPSLKVLDDVLKNNYQNVILMILDGLGTELLKNNLPTTSFLRSNKKDNIYSVFPPTTAAATIAYHSGLTPYESGWIGWACYYPQYDEIIENFFNTAFYTGQTLQTPPPADTLIKYETIYEKIIKKNPDVAYHKIFPAFEKDGCKTFEEMCNRISEVIQRSTNKKIISAYWTEPDHSAHYNGICCETLKQTLQNLDKNIEKMMAGLKDTLLIISADHGLRDIEEIFINDYPEICDMLEKPLTPETRFVIFFVKDGFKKDFPVAFEKYFSKNFKLLTTAEFLKTGLLGSGKKHPCLDGFFGDFVAIATSNKGLRYRSERPFKHMLADHAGISEEEMVIPLIVKAV